VLQIIKGPTTDEENELRDAETREIKSTRGNIYDRNGKLLASNALSYSVIMEDSTKIESQEQRNSIIHQLISVIERNGDTLYNEFFIRQNNKEEFEFTIDGSALNRFKKNVFTYLLDTKGNFKEGFEKYKDATAEEVYEYLRNGTGDNYTDMFGISDEYTVEDSLKIMGIRYALFCNYPKYIQITVASEVSDTTVAAVKESSAELLGVKVQQQASRVYHESLYFSHIIGYTGLISAEELEDAQAKELNYISNDVIGKSGLEKVYEAELSGKKGSELVSVGSSGKVIEVVDRIDPIAGNNIYLTIDSDLQRAAYHILEKEIAGILISKLQPDMDYGSKGESAGEITIPIYEVYYALINNNIIDIDAFTAADATTLEQQVYSKYQSTLSEVFVKLDTLLAMDSATTNNKAGDMEDFLDYFYKVLIDQNIILKDSIPDDDATRKSYIDDKISLSSFLQYALANNWVNLSKLGVGEEYYSAEELYLKLIDYTKKILKNDDIFNKKIYRNLVFSYNLSGTEICLLLFDQGVLKYNEGEINKLKNGNSNIVANNFMIDKLTSLEITPAMLALEPCSGSLVITDVKTGDVLAMVTYPSYDNNKFANKVDSEYYAQLLKDKSYPLINRPVMQRTAPGSTFKMVTSFAALEEGVTTPSERIRDLGEFDKVEPAAKCHIYPGTHGFVNIVDALKVSCNYYFYEMGWRLSIDSSGKFKEQLGLSRIEKYATLFGLNEKSGIELSEAIPEISIDDSVRSAIGQGTNDYTPVQLARYITTLANRGICYDLTLLDKIIDKDGRITQDNSASVNHDFTDINPTTWDNVLEGMYSVVNVSGGSVFPLFNGFEIKVAGKTGTSQVSKVNPNNALFVSFAPYENPEIAVTAVIPNGYTSHNAAELSKDIYSLYFNLDDPENLLEGEVTVPDTNIDAAIE
jgi:penicillin-binding protein 2